jgi:hypothetical protein
MIPDWCIAVFLLSVAAMFVGGLNFDDDFGVLVLLIGAAGLVASIIGAMVGCV